MSSFGARRKARVINVSDGDELVDSSAPSSNDTDNLNTDSTPTKPLFKSKSGQKSFRQSGLRKTFNTSDDGGGSTTHGSSHGDQDGNEDNQDDGPVVVRPKMNRGGSATRNRRTTTKASKVSFGSESADSDDGGGGMRVIKPLKKATLGKRVLESNATKRSSGIASNRIPVRSFRDEESDDRPKYSKEYLDELQSSTPNTPRDMSTIQVAEAFDEMDLDPSELEGAVIVDAPPDHHHHIKGETSPGTRILTDVEIREKKERRARLALEKDFLSVEDSDGDEYLGRKKKDDSRLKPDDEDLGEGFDSLVEDGGLPLGKRAEKQRRKMERQQMADMINAAEGHTSDSSEDSDAERRIAYEAAQTRAGMDGLEKPKQDQDQLQVPSKITALPNLAECVARLQLSLKAMEGEISGKAARVQRLRDERAEVVKREGEVQALLDETGRKYQEAMGLGQGKGDGSNYIGEVNSGGKVELMGERGLDSMGTTPLRAVEGMEEDEEVS